MFNQLIYFDHNATTPVLEGVKIALSSLDKFPLNLSSIHAMGRYARKLIEVSRKKIKTLLNLDDKYRIFFTTSATEANSLVFFGMPNMYRIVSAIEHDSILNNIKAGIDVVFPVESSGIVDVNNIKRIIKNFKSTNSSSNFLVSLMTANNETGIIQPISEVSKLVHEFGGIIHTDATQAVGKIALDFNVMNIDLATISGHKFGAPIGVGALIYRNNIDLVCDRFTEVYSGYGVKSTTQNVLAIYGLGIACDILFREQANNVKVMNLRNYLEDSIFQIAPESVLFRNNIERLPNTSMIFMPNVSAIAQIIYFDINNIMIGAGSACSFKKNNVSKVLLSMNLGEYVASNTVRISLGMSNNKNEVDKFIKAWNVLYKSKVISN